VKRAVTNWKNLCNSGTEKAKGRKKRRKIEKVRGEGVKCNIWEILNKIFRLKTKLKLSICRMKVINRIFGICK
jgi:hypothetical protein